MATREVLTLICDGCEGSEGEIGTHRIVLDQRRRVSVELCEDCLAFVAGLVAAGRRA